MFEVALEAGQSMPELRIDGPYGAPAEDVFSNEVAVLIGTGIGVTPFASVLKHLWHLRSQPQTGIRRLKRVEFIWICKDPNNFAWFQALLNSLEAQSLEQSEGDGEDFLRIHTYLTKKLDIDTANNIVLNSLDGRTSGSCLVVYEMASFRAHICQIWIGIIMKRRNIHTTSRR
jgi:NADPH oxidase